MREPPISAMDVARTLDITGGKGRQKEDKSTLGCPRCSIRAPYDEQWAFVLLHGRVCHLENGMVIWDHIFGPYALSSLCALGIQRDVRGIWAETHNITQETESPKVTNCHVLHVQN